MKKILILIFLLAFSCSLLAQSEKEHISEIRKLYSEIEQEKATYIIKTIEVPYKSTEGGQLTRYYKNNTIKLIEEHVFGETGKKVSKFYFEKGMLFFVFTQNTQYNRPIYWDEEKARENGDTIFFDINKSTIEENRYYFKDTGLFLWIDEKKREFRSRTDEFLDIEMNILLHKNLVIQRK